jgi:hypothetical protein
VLISDSNGCSSAASVYVLIDDIEDLNPNSNVLIYPNPSNGSFIVELPGCNDVVINVINLVGQTIFSTENTGIPGLQTANSKLI